MNTSSNTRFRNEVCILDSWICFSTTVLFTIFLLTTTEKKRVTVSLMSVEYLRLKPNKKTLIKMYYTDNTHVRVLSLSPTHTCTHTYTPSSVKTIPQKWLGTITTNLISYKSILQADPFMNTKSMVLKQKMGEKMVYTLKQSMHLRRHANRVFRGGCQNVNLTVLMTCILHVRITVTRNDLQNNTPLCCVGSFRLISFRVFYLFVRLSLC